MNKKQKKQLRFIIIICAIIIVVEILYVSYCVFYRGKKSIYFEGINAVETSGDSFVCVGSNNDNDNHYEKAKISMFNNKREKTFEKLYNVGYNSAFFGVLTDGDDSVAVGSYEKTEDDNKNLVRKALIVKYDKEGNVLFENDFGVLDNSKFTSIIKYDSDYYVTGQSIYKNTRVGDKDGGAILAKYDKDGNLLWNITYGSSKSAIFNDLIIVGDYIYAVGTDENYIGVIVKFDMDGNYIDYNDYKTTDSIGFSGIVNINNYIYVSGAVKSGYPDTDAIIVKYNLKCRYIDQVIYSGKGVERFNKLIVDDQNNLVVIGTMGIVKKSSKNNYGEYNYDGIIGKYNTRLKNIDLVTYGTERDDYFNDVINFGGNYLVVGYSSYEDGSYMSKFIKYSKALKVLEVG